MQTEGKVSKAKTDGNWLVRSSILIWLIRVFSGSGSQIQPTAVKVNCIDEVLLITESACGVLHPLDFCVERFTSSVGNPMLDEGQDVVESALKHVGGFNHRFELAS